MGFIFTLTNRNINNEENNIFVNLFITSNTDYLLFT